MAANGGEVAVVALPDADKGEKLVAVANEPSLELGEIREAIAASSPELSRRRSDDCLILRFCVHPFFPTFGCAIER